MTENNISNYIIPILELITLQLPLYREEKGYRGKTWNHIFLKVCVVKSPNKWLKRESFQVQNIQFKFSQVAGLNAEWRLQQINLLYYLF